MRSGLELYVVKCEAPGGFGPDAILEYDITGSYVKDVKYLDLEFRVWLGSELVTKEEWFAVSEALWKHLCDKVKGVSVRKMSVTPAEEDDLHPDRIIPTFVELVLDKSANGHKEDGGWVLVSATIPDADMFSGLGLPLIVSEHAKELLISYGVSETKFSKVRIE